MSIAELSAEEAAKAFGASEADKVRWGQIWYDVLRYDELRQLWYDLVRYDAVGSGMVRQLR